MAMNKVIDIQSAIDKVKKNDTVLLGGFGNVGAPMHLLYELAKRPEIDGLTLVTEDMHNGGLSFVQGPEALLRTGQLKKIIVSFIGSHKAVESAIMEGRLELEFVPQGTLIERIRAARGGPGRLLYPDRRRHRGGAGQGDQDHQRQEVSARTASARQRSAGEGL